MHNIIIEISARQFLLNIQSIRKHINNNSVKICLPVKSNAYGHGLIEIAKLAQNQIDYLAVGYLAEAITLRERDITTPILIFGSCIEEQIPLLIKHNVEITVASLYQTKLLANYCNTYSLKCKIHLKLDTGMNRIGFRVESIKQIVSYILANQNLDLVGMYSHLASSDEVDSSVTSRQLQIFKQAVDYIKRVKPDVICHIANSGAILNQPDSYFDMVRPGIMCYGYTDQIGITKHLANIAPCLSLKSRVIYFKTVYANQGISYNHKYTTEDMTHLITVPVGYGDGYRRSLSNKGEIIFNDKKYTISGTICMNMFMVDIGFHTSAYVGDEVILIGKSQNQEITLASIAQKCDTIVYEILCNLNENIRRIVV